MDNQNLPSSAPEIKRFKRWKITGVILLNLFLLSVAFGAACCHRKNEFLKAVSLKEAVYAGQVYNKYITAPANKLTKDIDFNLFWDVWDQLKEKYVDKDKLDDKKMFYGALKD